MRKVPVGSMDMVFEDRTAPVSWSQVPLVRQQQQQQQPSDGSSSLSPLLCTRSLKLKYEPKCTFGRLSMLCPQRFITSYTSITLPPNKIYTSAWGSSASCLSSALTCAFGSLSTMASEDSEDLPLGCIHICGRFSRNWNSIGECCRCAGQWALLKWPQHGYQERLTASQYVSTPMSTKQSCTELFEIHYDT